MRRESISCRANDRTNYNNGTHTNNHTHRRSSISNRRRSGRNSMIISPLTILLALAIIIISLTFGIRTVNASSKEDKTMYRYFTSITVHQNDTLWDIAEEYAYNEKTSSYVSNIMSINNMKDTTIYSGQDIIIYYYSDEIK